MSPTRREIDAWWRSPIASIVLVASGLAVVFVEVVRGDNADAAGYTAGLALVGLGITGRIQSWALGSRDQREEGESSGNDTRS